MKNKIDDLISGIVSERGFLPVSKYVYAFKLDSEKVEHFLYVHTVFSEQKNDSYIYASYGFRILRCDLFALEVMRSCSEIENKNNRKYNIYESSLFNIDVGFFGVKKNYRWNVWVDNLSEEDFTREFRIKLNDVDAFKNTVFYKKQLFNLLISDYEPFRWFRCNPVFRASAIILLGLDFGCKLSYLVQIIEAYREILEVQGGIRDLRKFLKCVFDLASRQIPEPGDLIN